MNSNLVILDYDAGNIFSVGQACRRVGFNIQISSDSRTISKCDALILPGVGAFNSAMLRLKQSNLIEPIKSFVDSGRPVLGICLGMQLLFNTSDEFGTHKGLELVNGQVKSFLGQDSNYKIPQIQWNKVDSGKNNLKIFKGINTGEYFYFLHSFYAEPSDPNLLQAYANYAGINYCCALESANLNAVQFHPEKSGEIGLEIFKNFKELT